MKLDNTKKALARGQNLAPLFDALNESLAYLQPSTVGDTKRERSTLNVEGVVQEFTYRLNAMEVAGRCENPAANGYAAKRRAVLDFVRSLAQWSVGASPQEPGKPGKGI